MEEELLLQLKSQLDYQKSIDNSVQDNIYI